MNLPNVVFSRWIQWANRTQLDRIDKPGVYILAHFTTLPAGNGDPQAQEVIYVGETCDQSLRVRWNQFHRCAFEGKDGHSGGKTYWRVFDGKGAEKPYVAAFPVAELNTVLCPLFTRYVERKLILEYALKWNAAPICNTK